VEDQDRTPEEEADVEGHAHDPGALELGALAKDDDDDFEAHALRDPGAMEPGALAKDDDDDFEAHALRDPGAMDPGAMRSDEDEDPGAI
jgi:hypothetical protein